MGFLCQQGCIHRIGDIAQGFAGQFLNIGGSLQHGSAGGHRTQVDAVISHGHAHGIQAQHHRDCGHRNRGAQKQSRVQLNPLKHGPASAAGADTAPANVVQLLPDLAGKPGDIAPEKQHQLGQYMIRLRKTAGHFFPAHVAQSLPGLLNLPLDKMHHPAQQPGQIRVPL